jgi:branched-chain amino acid aminotransferase
MGIETETRPLPLKEFMEADEVFLSTSGGGVTPIRRVKDRTFSNDAPGPVTMQLYERFHEWLMRDDLRTPV